MIGCKRCGTYNACDACEACGRVVHVGEWGSCPHGTPSKGTTAPDYAYFDIGLGKQINNQAERWKEMRRQNVQYNT